MTSYVVDVARIWLGTVLLVSLYGKLRTWTELVRWVGSLGLPPLPGALGLVTVESSIVVLVALPSTADVGLLLGALTMAGFALVITWLRARGIRVACRCLGATTRPMGVTEVVRNLILASACVAASSLGRVASSPLSVAQAAILGLALTAVTVQSGSLHSGK
ncbi:MAG TPA: MauE/DoxX family redox-associated membrane protein [Rugosimonospora sp.]|nr:MauE/DoxX family redox-associated membrane protein [Rugosimonospora sp.]